MIFNQNCLSYVSVWTTATDSAIQKAIWIEPKWLGINLKLVERTQLFQKDGVAEGEGSKQQESRNEEDDEDGGGVSHAGGNDQGECAQVSVDSVRLEYRRQYNTDSRLCSSGSHVCIYVGLWCFRFWDSRMFLGKVITEDMVFALVFKLGKLNKFSVFALWKAELMQLTQRKKNVFVNKKRIMFLAQRQQMTKVLHYYTVPSPGLPTYFASWTIWSLGVRSIFPGHWQIYAFPFTGTEHVAFWPYSITNAFCTLTASSCPAEKAIECNLHWALTKRQRMMTWVQFQKPHLEFLINWNCGLIGLCVFF